MKKIKSVKDSKHFKMVAKQFKRSNGLKLTIGIYKELFSE